MNGIPPLDHAISDLESAVLELDGYAKTFARLVEGAGTDDLDSDVAGFLMTRANEMARGFEAIHDRLFKLRSGKEVV